MAAQRNAAGPAGLAGNGNAASAVPDGAAGQQAADAQRLANEHLDAIRQLLEKILAKPGNVVID